MTNERQDNPCRTFGLRHSTLVILLTILAGCLRFYSLDKPSIWGDEASSWRRISGSYQQMVDELRYAGFMPGHYLVTWWIKDGLPLWGHFEKGPPPEAFRGRDFFRRRDAGDDPARLQRDVLVPTFRLVAGGINPTPFVMRFVPALCGTLTVPAIYFLASQLVLRRTALLAALFTCCSAYMLGYSRDAKMYAQLWFFATLHVGCLLWWLRTYAGREQVARSDALLRWTCWLVSGLAMIAFHAVGLAVVGIEVLVFLATLPQRFGWGRALFARALTKVRATADRAPYLSRDVALDLHGVAEKRPRWRPRLFVPPVVGFAVGVAAIVWLFASYREFSRFYDRVEPDSAASAQFDVNDAGIGWVESYNRRRTAPGHFLENASAYLMGWEWMKPDQQEGVDPQVLSRLRLATTTLLAAAAIGVLPWRRLQERMTDDPKARWRGPMPLTAMLIVGAWLLVPAYGFYCASGAWDDVGRRASAALPNATIAGALFPNAANGAGAGALRGAVTNALKPWYDGARPLASARESLRALPWRELFVVRGLGSPRWWALAAIAGAIALFASSRPAARAVDRDEPPLIGRVDFDAPSPRALRRRRIAGRATGLLVDGARAVLVGLILWALLLLVFVVVPQQDKSVWMPRYLGFAWPAFAIGLCALIGRLPLLPVRWLVVAALLFVNLANFRARLAHGEPPTGRIAADQIAAGDGRAARFFSATIAWPGPGTPGSGAAYTLPNDYYYAVMKPVGVSPNEAYEVVDRYVRGWRGGNDYAQRIRDAARGRGVNDVYLWATVEPEEPTEKNLRAALPAEWQPAEAGERWQIYDHWTWRKLYVIERQHWTRGAPTTTRPAAKP